MLLYNVASAAAKVERKTKKLTRYRKQDFGDSKRYLTYMVLHRHCHTNLLSTSVLSAS
jgi:hypothetical protein